MTDKEIALSAVDALKREYPDAICSLTYTDPLQLLIATRLAAQCTDARVNMVTPALFRRFKSVDDFAAAEPSEVEEYIKSCGLYKTKARDIVNMAKALKENFGGTVPDSIGELVTLPGIGRKTANLIVGDIFGKSAVVVDTHCIRITSQDRKNTAQSSPAGGIKRLLPQARAARQSGLHGEKAYVRQMLYERLLPNGAKRRII